MGYNRYPPQRFFHGGANYREIRPVLKARCAISPDNVVKLLLGLFLLLGVMQHAQNIALHGGRVGNRAAHEDRSQAVRELEV